MTGPVRKLALTVHITASVGWTGAVLSFLGLAIAGLASEDVAFVRGVYPALEAMAWFVILPLGVASLVSGVVQGLGTKWGLVRHYWVIFKLVINVVATVVLVLYLGAIERLSDVAASGRLELSGEDAARVQAVVHSGAAALLLIGAIVLSVYKPRGVTRFGRRP